jgi:hypothetical protein
VTHQALDTPLGSTDDGMRFVIKSHKGPAQHKACLGSKRKGKSISRKKVVSSSSEDTTPVNLIAVPTPISRRVTKSMKSLKLQGNRVEETTIIIEEDNPPQLASPNKNQIGNIHGHTFERHIPSIDEFYQFPSKEENTSVSPHGNKNKNMVYRKRSL